MSTNSKRLLTSFFHIWSEYGDEIQVDKEPKLIRWNPSQKKIAQRINVGSATTDKGHHPPPPQHQLEKKMIEIKRYLPWSYLDNVESSVTRLGDLLDFGQVFKAFGNN